VSQSVSLPRPAAMAIVVALLACAAGAWVITVQQSSSMAMTVAMMGAGLFLVTWLVMMIAMMFPSVAPMTLAFAGVSRARGDGLVPVVAFIAAYLFVWTAAGLVPLSFLQGINVLWMTPPSWLARAGGLVIIVAGVYQFTPLKDACLRACRSPLGFVMTHDFGRGMKSAVRAGAAHGVYCLGCCWALMAVLAVLGLMNIAWMAVIAAAFFIEKNVRFGDLLPKAVGVACIAGGLAVLLI
jgi:predicted metal-binding membrane protein